MSGKSFFVFLLTTTLPFVLVGCGNIGAKNFGLDIKYPDLNYTGDGSFNDNGRSSGINRFVLDLGSVDLSDDSYHTYNLKGLPEVKFICYLRLDHPLPLQGSPKDFKSEKTIVEMKLVEGDSEIFSESAQLKDWIWSGTVGALKSDLYTSRTIFTPDKKEYKLTVKITGVNSESLKGEVLLMGGGWYVP